ncbi:MAG: RNA polymerase sigma factor, partial [Chloroflexi bacterium]|nr:RNA polymerase sigma factor [Chloroflexota bacterium]
MNDRIFTKGSVDDGELVRKSKDGDLDSFNQLVESYQKLVYNIGLRMLGDSQAAEDACQDAFLSAWRNLAGFRGGNFKAWLLRIASNVCRDQLRKRKRHPTTSLDGLPFEPEGPPSSESPEDRVLRLELRDEIQKGLSMLPHEQRLAVILCDVQGLSYEEASQVMGCSLGTVRSRLS